MKKIFIIFLIFISSCTTNKVVKNHGNSFVESKSKELTVDKSNKNDVLDVLGPPSTKSSFDNRVWIYIETKKTSTSIFKLGKKKTEKNNVLILQLNNMGLLKSIDFFDMAKMNDIEFTKKITSSEYQKNSYVYNLLTSLRHKINSPIERSKTKD